MIVAPASSGRRRICSATANPSILGICASSKTSGNGLPAPDARSSAARAEPPFSSPLGAHAPAPEHLFQDAAVGGVIVHHEHRQVLQVDSTSSRRLFWRSFEPAEISRKVEGTALTGLALHRESATHQFHQASRDGQSESGPPIPPRRGVIGLFKRFEDLLLLFG